MRIKRILNNNIFIISTMSLISFIIVLFNKNLNNLSILSDDFLITYMLYMLGFALTVSAILYSFVEKVNTRFNQNQVNESNTSAILKRLKNLLKELKEDTLLIFLILISNIFIALFKDINIPILKLPKNELINFCKIISIFLSSYSIRDIILTVFKILNINF
ncbi:hypothetical protein [Paraclostridium sordellii]|uniref:hypothetical protein n=1 Tax=Paraclostridium sordellii TaxID=1505 RepID=UPI0005E94B4F|nr:hypothetical protein [Paeniclostridium sordellii]MDU1456262.1 hypothetical protein [Paeniclostridium sordellii]CEP83961.1 Uncharacterised protein [[Clostridium] sordellii] [Paeniclostridium sordellii]